MSFRTLLFTIAALAAGSLTQVMAQVMAQAVVGTGAAEAQSIWSGIYSEAQAFRGEKVVDTLCIGCHGAGLEGGDSGPKIVGGNFLSAWNTKSVGDLFKYIAETMPENAPGTLKPEEVASSIAYMFKHNGLPSGPGELAPGGEALGAIKILETRP